MTTTAPSTPPGLATTSIPGRLFGHRPDGGDGCEAEIQPGRVIAWVGAARWLLPLESVHLALGGTDQDMLVLELSGERGLISLYLPRREAMAALRRQDSPALAARLGELERARRRRHRRTALGWLLVAAAIVATLWGSVRGLDRTFRWAVGRVPPAWEASLGRGLLAELYPERDRLDDPAVGRALGPIRDRLFAAAGPTPYRFEVHVVRSQDPNALALPGGTIVFTSALLERCRSADQAAGVLAHEMAHVLDRHGLERIADHLRFRLLGWLVIGDLDSARGVVLGQAARVAALAHSRDAERQADRRGLELLDRAGIDPRGLLRLLTELERSSRGQVRPPTFLATHPGGAERIGVLRQALRERAGAPPARPVEVDWEALQQWLARDRSGRR